MFKKKEPKESSEKNGLIEEIAAISDLIASNEQRFNMATDEQLIEAMIYEQRSLQSRYAYLLKLAKENGIKIEYIDRL